MVYHEDYDEFLNKLKEWNKLFKDNSDLIFLGKDYKDLDKAKSENKNAIFIGFHISFTGSDSKFSHLKNKNK